MPLPIYDAADFTAGLLGLLPTGRAWPRDPETVLAQVVSAQAPSYARLHARANYLVVDAFPSTAVELLPEWEYSLGLPDPCAGEDQTIAARQAHVVARLTQTNGPSPASLIAFAATIGFAITIQEYVPARYGALGSVYGTAVYKGAEWATYWQITAPSVIKEPALYGSAHYDDPYVTYAGQALVCEMARLKPAHTRLTYDYTS